MVMDSAVSFFCDSIGNRPTAHGSLQSPRGLFLDAGTTIRFRRLPRPYIAGFLTSDTSSKVGRHDVLSAETRHICRSERAGSSSAGRVPRAAFRSGEPVEPPFPHVSQTGGRRSVNTLVLNVGSSTLKFQLIRTDPEAM